jgi:DNA invertase Pin-like site-specific DNA recombinase
MRVALYTRVSTAGKSRSGANATFDQNPEVQETQLRELAAQRGWAVHHVYSDRESGAKEKRPGLEALMADARRGQFDDTCTPMGKAMFTIIAAMAELERNVIRERVRAGLEYARQHGTRSGNAIGRPKVLFHRDQATELRAQGRSWREVARTLGTSVASVRRACQEPLVGSQACQKARK